MQLQTDFETETGIDAHSFPKKWSTIAPYILDLAAKKEICPSLCELHNGIHIHKYIYLYIISFYTYMVLLRFYQYKYIINKYIINKNL